MTTFFRAAFCSTAMILLSAVYPVFALTAEAYSSGPIVVLDDDPYTAGTRAMNERRWPDAVSAFDKVINEKGKRVDSALYWKAYSLKKLARHHWQLPPATSCMRNFRIVHGTKIALSFP